MPRARRQVRRDFNGPAVAVQGEFRQPQTPFGLEVPGIGGLLRKVRKEAVEKIVADPKVDLVQAVRDGDVTQEELDARWA